MATVQFVKQPGGVFRPANQSDYDSVSRIKNGALVHAEVKQPRNPYFHRKFYAMLNFAFDYWEPEPIEYNGELLTPEKNFDRFRKDVTILAGYRVMTVNIKNEARYEAISISFASMDETEFAELYQAVFNVLWRMVLFKTQGMTPEIAENSINQLLSFD